MKTLYDRIMRTDKRIRFAALVSVKGEILEGGMREGLEPIEPLERTPDLISKLVAHELAEAREEFLGKPEYSVLVHEKLIAVIYHKGDRAVLITTERKLPFGKLTSITRLLKRSS